MYTADILQTDNLYPETPHNMIQFTYRYVDKPKLLIIPYTIIMNNEIVRW